MTDGFDDLDPDALAALDGPAAAAFASRKARLTEALLSGETGVQFEALALFSEPLFSLYEVDASGAFQLQTDPAGVGDDVVALLETARVLWAFVSLSPSERAKRRPQLAAQLVGEDPSEEDWVGLDGLVETASIHWQALLPEEIDAAQATGHDTLGFDALLRHPAFRVGPESEDATHAGFGSDSLSETEARALFAQPLLEDPEVLIDPDAFEDALARADDYWQLARETDGDAAPAARAWAEAHASAPQDVAPLAAEAERMVERFRTLFPRHAS